MGRNGISVLGLANRRSERRGRVQPLSVEAMGYSLIGRSVLKAEYIDFLDGLDPLGRILQFRGMGLPSASIEPRRRGGWTGLWAPFVAGLTVLGSLAHENPRLGHCTMGMVGSCMAG
jgi:hypothetical protein